MQGLVSDDGILARVLYGSSLTGSFASLLADVHAAHHLIETICPDILPFNGTPGSCHFHFNCFQSAILDAQTHEPVPIAAIDQSAVFIYLPRT